jgi:hypothetical protein
LFFSPRRLLSLSGNTGKFIKKNIEVTRKKHQPETIVMKFDGGFRRVFQNRKRCAADRAFPASGSKTRNDQTDSHLRFYGDVSAAGRRNEFGTRFAIAPVPSGLVFKAKSSSMTGKSSGENGRFE